MSTQAEVTPPEDESIIAQEIEQQAKQSESVDTSADTAKPQDESAKGDADEVVVTIGEESPPQEEQAPAPEWVRELRKKNREDTRRIRELEEQLKAAKGEDKQSPTLSAKPTLEGYDYDAEKYELALSIWYEQKRAEDERKAKAQAEQAEADRAWQEKLQSYNAAKASLKVRDFEDAETVAQEVLSTTQQGIILQGAENPAVLIYALGKNSAKAKELAAIKDPVKYAFAIAKLETQLKVSQRKAPPPERTVSGTGRIAGTVDSNLERLREEAAKTGDYTKVVQYRNQQRQKQRS